MTLKKTKAPGKTSPKPRAKELNFIFFVDASRTHSFKMPLKTFRWLLIVACVVCVWAMGSIGLIYSLATDLVLSREQAGQLLTTIFDYQARYDGAYENAYSSGAVVASKASLPPTAPTSKPADQFKSAAIPPQEMASIDDEPEGETSDSDPILSKSKGDIASDLRSTENQIEIAEPSFSERDGRLRVDFAIKNLAPETKTSGRFIAIAHLKSESGKDQFLVEPPSVRTSADGKPQAKSRGTRFQIKRFKPVSLEFSNSNQQVGSKYVDIYISIENEHGQVKEYSFPIEHVKIVAQAQLKPGASAQGSGQDEGASVPPGERDSE